MRWNDKNMYKNHPDVKTKIERGCKEAGASLKRAGKNFDTLTILYVTLPLFPFNRDSLDY